MKVKDILQAPKPRNLQLHRTLSGTKGGPMRDRKKEAERGMMKHKGRVCEELEDALLESAELEAYTIEPAGAGFVVGTKAKAGPTLDVLRYVYKAVGEKKGVTVKMKSGRTLEPGYKAMMKILDNRPNGLVFIGVEKDALQAAVDSGIEKVKRDVIAKEKHKAGAPERKKEAAKFDAEERKRSMAAYDQKYGKGTWKRVTYRQEGGDDGYSYVVRVDGRSKWNGLTQREAMHYKEQEVNDIAKREKLGKYADVKEAMMGAGQARRKLGERVPYDSFKAWFADLPNGASTVVDEATAVTTAHGRSKDFEGVCGKFDSKKNEGWIYEHYLKKSNLAEGRRHVYGKGDEELTSHPNKLMQRIGKGDEVKVLTKSGVAKIVKVQFYNGGTNYKLDRDVKLADGSMGSWVDPKEVSFDLEKGAAPTAKSFAHKHAVGV